MPASLYPLRSISWLLVALALAACSDAGQPEAASRPAPLVEAVAARYGALPIEEVVPAVVRARNQVLIRPEVAGRVVEVLVRSGATVRQGQPLVRIDDTELRERLRQAEADVRLEEAAAAAADARAAEVEARAKRLRSLEREGLLSQQELESMEAQLASARASAQEAEARVEQARAVADERRSLLARTVIRAPVAGRLGERAVEVGMQVDSGTVLFVVGDLDQLIAEVTLTEDALSRVAEGQPVLLEPRGADAAPARGTLARISPFLAADSFTTIGEIDLDNTNGALRPGMFVTARILVGESTQATLVPVSALREDSRQGGRGVYVIDEADGLEAAEPSPESEAPRERRVRFLPVEVLAEGSGQAGVAGIDEGTWVVTVGQHLLGTDGGAGASDDGTAITARVRPVPWERVASLQSLQSEDLLEAFLAKQRILAAEIGAEIPASESVVNEALARAAARDAGGPGAAAGS